MKTCMKTFSHLRVNLKQGDSIWLKCYSPVKIGKALTRIMKLDHMVKQMMWKKRFSYGKLHVYD